MSKYFWQCIHVQYMEPRFASEDLIWPEAKLRAISDPRTQNEVSYTVYIPTTILYTIYFILSDVVLLGCHFVFTAHVQYYWHMLKQK